MKYLSILALILLAYISCDNQTKKKSENIYYEKNYKSIDSLISVMGRIPEAKDTIFLGFRLGMTKKEYRNHINKLRSEGKTIKYEKDLYAKTVLTNTKIELGDRYVYYTPIAMKEYDKEMTGDAKCVLIPSYNKKGEMLALKIISFEDWDDYYFGRTKWIKENIRKKYYDYYFNRKDLNSVISNVCEKILEKDYKNVYSASNSMVILHPSFIGDVEYRSTKSFITDAVVELKSIELKKEESKKTTF